MSANLNLMRLTAAEAASVLTQAGAKHVTTEAVAADIKLGAPTNDDGTLNLLHYTAWMIRESKRGA